MKRLIEKAALAVGMVLVCAASVQAQSQPANSLIGRWKDEANPTMQTEFSLQHDDRFQGRLINDTGQKLKNGLVVFKDFRWDEQAKTYTGTLIKPEDGTEFNAAIVLTNENLLTVSVKKFFMTRTIHFVRIK